MDIDKMIGTIIRDFLHEPPTEKTDGAITTAIRGYLDAAMFLGYVSDYAIESAVESTEPNLSKFGLNIADQIVFTITAKIDGIYFKKVYCFESALKHWGAFEIIKEETDDA